VPPWIAPGLPEGAVSSDVLGVNAPSEMPPVKILVGAGLVVALAGAGCDACRNDHPYVPYTIGDASAHPTSSSPSPSASPPPPAPVGDAGEVAPASSTVWETNGLRLRAPEGHHFEHGFFADLDGDTKTDAVVVVRSFADPTRFATFLYASAQDTPVALTTVTLPVSPRGPGRHALARVGQAQLFLAVGVAAADTTQGARRLSIVDLVAEKGKPLAPRTRMEVTIADPSDAPELDVSADPADRDGDGTADLSLVFSIRGAAGARASVRFFDRPAGLARDPDAPRADLAAAGLRARERAKKPKEAVQALSLVASGLALAKAVCPELPGARATAWSNVDVPQCRADDALGDLALAEVLAYTSLGRPFAATAAMRRFRGPFLARTKEREREAEKALDAAFPVVTARDVKTLRATPLAQKRHVPSWSVLSFADDGSLDVLTQEGVVRVSLPSTDERKLESSPWPTAVVAEGGARLVEVYDACKGGKLRATFTPRSSAPDGEPHDVVLPLESALVPPCTTSRGEPADVVPVSFGAKGLELVVGGDLVLVEPSLERARGLEKPLAQPGQRGAAASSDGASLALGMGADVVVTGRGGARRVRGLGASLTGCAISNDETRVACVDGGKAVVGTVR